MNIPAPDSALSSKAARIKLLIMDVDGVLTDGRIYYSDHGHELKAFNILDGQGLKMLREQGFKLGIITGRESPLVQRRAEELGIELLYQNCKNKLQTLTEILQNTQLGLENTAFVGDDLPDLACIRQVALGIAVANAHPLVQEHADYTTSASGGMGAVREVCDLLLMTQNRYEDALIPYFQGG